MKILQYLLIVWLGIDSEPPKENFQEVYVIIRDLGNQNWREREKASKKLAEMLSANKLRVGYIERIAEGKVKNGEKLFELEIRKRCQRLANDYLYKDVKKTDIGISYLEFAARYPLGYFTKYETSWWLILRYFTKDYHTFSPLDLGAVYYNKAKGKYWKNHGIDLDSVALTMFLADLRRGGMPLKDINRLVDRVNEYFR